jgi:hypothetical protein
LNRLRRFKQGAAAESAKAPDRAQTVYLTRRADGKAPPIERAEILPPRYPF